MPVRGRVQDRLVDDVIVSVPAPDRLEAIDLQLGEQGFVEALDLVGTVEGVAGAAGNVVLGVAGETLDDRIEVTLVLGAVMALH
jgi:hypothetical protein